MTKYMDANSRKNKKNIDIISISDEISSNKPDKIDYVCSYCQYNLIKINETEYFCKKCSISQFPDQEEMRSKHKLSTPIGLNIQSLVAYPPEPPDLSRPEVEVKGGLKALQQKGIKITSYQESNPR